MENLEHKLDRPRKQNGRLKHVGALFLAGIGTLMLLGPVTSSKGAESKDPTEPVPIERDSVPVFYRMDTTSITVMQLQRGDLVEITPEGTTAEGAWCRVREASVWGRSGYALCKDLQHERLPAEPPVAPTGSSDEQAPSMADLPLKTGTPKEKVIPEAPTTAIEPEVTTQGRYAVQVATLVVERNAVSLKKRLENLGYTPVIRMSTAPITEHRVYGGEFSSREEAERTARRMNADGFSAHLIEVENGNFRLEIGSSYNLNAAIDLSHRLQRKNYTSKIVSKVVLTPVHLVQVGKYEQRADAVTVLQALKLEGFNPILVKQ